MGVKFSEDRLDPSLVLGMHRVQAVDQIALLERVIAGERRYRFTDIGDDTLLVIDEKEVEGVAEDRFGPAVTAAATHDAGTIQSGHQPTPSSRVVRI